MHSLPGQAIPVLAFLVALAAFLGGCSGTPEGAKPKTLPDIDKPVAVRELWRHSLAIGDSYVFHPAIVGNTVFAAGSAGEVVRFEGERQVWRVDLGRRLSGGVAADRGMLAVGTLKGELLALSPENGKEIWRSQLGAEIVAPAALLDDQVVVRTGDNRMFGLDRSTGNRRWSFQRSIPPLSIRVTAAPVVADRLVFAGYPGGKLVAINTQSGQSVWEGTVALPKGATELERMSDVVAAPVIGAKEVCAASHLGRLACFDLASGSLLWARDVSVTASIVLDHKALFIADDNGIVQAFDRVTGSTLWKQDKLVNRRLTGPFLYGAYVVLADDTETLHLLDRELGAFRGRFPINAERIDSDMKAFENGVVFLTRDGQLIAIQVDQ